MCIISNASGKMHYISYVFTGICVAYGEFSECNQMEVVVTYMFLSPHLPATPATVTGQYQRPYIIERMHSYTWPM